jgi:hypothetical protein
MKRIIATVKLVPGSRGYFDPLTGINLSPSSSVGYVREGDNVSNIRRAIKENKIRIVGGKLPPAVSIKPVKAKLIKEEPVLVTEPEEIIESEEDRMNIEARRKINEIKEFLKELDELEDGE